MTTERKCKACGIEKPLYLFKQYAPGKHRKTCRECMAADQRKYQQRYAEKKRLLGGTPDTNARFAALEAQVQTILAILDKHDYNTTET